MRFGGLVLRPRCHEPALAEDSQPALIGVVLFASKETQCEDLSVSEPHGSHSDLKTGFSLGAVGAINAA